MSRVVVVGAGVGGLATAARLAALGHEVTVCERSAEVGGKLGRLERDGFRFDTGPSLLTMPHVLRELFDATGDPLDTALDLVPVEPAIRHRFADGTTVDSTADLATYCARLDAALGPPAGEEWRRLTARAARIWDATRGPFLESPLRGVRTLAAQAWRLDDLATVAPWRTLRSLGAAYLTDPRLRLLLDRYATYTGSDPRHAPAALAVIPYVEQAYGAWYVRGGLHGLATALRDRALERGVRLLTGTEVSAVELDGGRVSGVRLAAGGSGTDRARTDRTRANGSLLPADVVVADVDARTVLDRLLPPGLPVLQGTRRRLDRAVPSLSGFALMLGVRGRTPGLAHHTVLFPTDYDAELDAVFGSGAGPPRPVADPTVYVSVPDDPAVHPAGDEAWFVLVNAPRHGAEHSGVGTVDAGTVDAGTVDWDAPGLAETYADRVLRLLAERGLDVRDRLAFREVRTPADLERATGAPGGAIYGSSSNGAAAAFLRPANRSPVRGLFLVGGSAHPGGGLPLVTLSARIVAGLVGPA